MKNAAALLFTAACFVAPVASAADATPDTATTDGTQSDSKTDKGDASAKEPVAEAPPTAPAKQPDKENGEEATYGHAMQFGIRAGIVLGYKMDFRYDKSPFCRQPDLSKGLTDQQKICGFGAPPGAEVALSFALLDSIEPYVFGRFGFSGESKTNTSALQLFGVGARIYTMSDSRLKIFVEPALAYETESGAGNPLWSPAGLVPVYKKDLVFHVGIGPEYDFAKAVGAYVNGGIDVGVLRAISATLLLNIGIQVRVP